MRRRNVAVFSNWWMFSFLLLFTFISINGWAGWGNPTVKVTLNHAPAFPIQLGTVVFARAESECAQLVIDRVTEMFVQSNINVVDRVNLDTVASEHRLNLSGFVDSSTAVEIGKFLGADALFVVRTSRCAQPQVTHSTQRLQYYDGSVGLEYHTKVRAVISGSFQTVDLKTGKIFSAKQIHGERESVTKSKEGYPESVPLDQVQDSAVLEIVMQIQRMFFAWSEQKDLVFFDDDDCNLKAAYNLFKASSFEAALEQSKKNLEDCRANQKRKEKHERHALHNIGMVYFAMGDYENALPMFQQAVALNGGTWETQALRDCQIAQGLKAEMERYEEKIALGETAPAGASASKGFGTKDAAQSSDSANVEERLKKLEELFKKGLITKQEYETKKKEILEAL